MYHVLITRPNNLNSMVVWYEIIIKKPKNERFCALLWCTAMYVWEIFMPCWYLAILVFVIFNSIKFL